MELAPRTFNPADRFEVVTDAAPDRLALVAGSAQRATALVVWREGSQPDLDALRTHTRTPVAGSKVPKEFHVLDTVQRTPAGTPDSRWAKTGAVESSS